MPSPGNSAWNPLAIGGAILVGLAANAVFNEIDALPPKKDYEWFPQINAKHTDTDLSLAALKEKAHRLYTSIPLKFIHIATKRVRQTSRRSRDDRWKAAIFHTGWEARLVLETPLLNTRELALSNLSSMLDNVGLRHYEWSECSPVSEGDMAASDLVQEIKRLACIVHRNYRPSDFAVAVKRLQQGRQKSSSDPWVSGLWCGSHEGFVQGFMWAGQSGELQGNERGEALWRLKEKLKWQRG